MLALKIYAPKSLFASRNVWEPDVSPNKLVPKLGETSGAIGNIVRDAEVGMKDPEIYRMRVQKYLNMPKLKAVGYLAGMGNHSSSKSLCIQWIILLDQDLGIRIKNSSSASVLYL